MDTQLMFAQGRQQLFNNLWYGENTRSRNLILHSAELFMGSGLKEEEISQIVERHQVRKLISATGYTIPDPSRILVGDGSHWGGRVDLTNTISRGMIGYILKATDGTVPTKYWDINMPHAQEQGLATGSYHWLYPDRYVNAKLQARAYWNRIKQFPIQIPPAVDFEWTYWGGNPAYPNWNDMWIFLNEFLLISGGLKPMIYTAKGFTDIYGVVPSSIQSLIAGWWLATYGSSYPLYPQGVTKHKLHQFSPELEQNHYAPSSTGKKELDGNYFWSNDKNVFYSFANMSETTPPTEPEPPTPPDYVSVEERKTGLVITTELNVREGEGVQYPVINSLFKDDKVFGILDAVTGWVFFGRIERANGTVEKVNGWCSGYYKYLFLEDNYETDTVITTPLEGTSLYKIRVGGHTDTYVTIVDMFEKSAHITDTRGELVKVSDVAQTMDADIVVNMDAWDLGVSAPHYPQGVAVSEGDAVSADGGLVKTGVPFLNASYYDKLSIRHDDYNDLFNTGAGFRYLVQNYVKADYLDGIDLPKYTERHPRKAIGLINEDTLIIIKTDGRSSQSAGLTLSELTDVFVALNVKTAFDGDSGGSANLWIAGELVGDLIDGSERPVVNHLVIKTQKEDTGGNPPMGDVKLTTAEQGKGRSVRRDASQGQAHIYGDTFASIPSTGYAIADDSYEYTSDVYNNGVLVAKAGDIWYRVVSINDVPVDGGYGWTGGIHLGVQQVVVEIEPPIDPTPEPIPEFPTSIWVAIAEGGEQKKYDVVA